MPKKQNVQRKAKSKQRNPNAPKRGAKSKRTPMQRSVLDGAAVNYARMLRDPCGAQLTGFYGGTSGYVQRFSSTFAIGTTAASTSGACCIIPGNAGLVAYQDVASESSTFSTFSYGANSFPGYSFLTSSSKGFRVLAFCAKIFTNASENARSGFVFYGNVGNNELPVATNTPAMVETLVPISVRTPTDCVEIKWFPGTGDTQYATMGSGVTNNNECQAVLFGWSGQPAAVGFKVVLTAVIEWIPNISSGTVENAMQPSPSTSSIEQVKLALFKSDPNWWHKPGYVLQRAIKGAMASGTVMGGVVAGISALTMG